MEGGEGEMIQAQLWGMQDHWLSRSTAKHDAKPAIPNRD